MKSQGKKDCEDHEAYSDRSALGEEISLVAFCTQLAFVLAIPVIVGALIGWWFDHIFATEIIFIVIGTALGVLLATVITVRKVTALIRNADQQYEQLKNVKKHKRGK